MPLFRWLMSIQYLYHRLILIRLFTKLRSGCFLSHSVRAQCIGYTLRTRTDCGLEIAVLLRMLILGQDWSHGLTRTENLRIRTSPIYFLNLSLINAILTSLSYVHHPCIKVYLFLGQRSPLP